MSEYPSGRVYSPGATSTGGGGKSKNLVSTGETEIQISGLRRPPATVESEGWNSELNRKLKELESESQSEKDEV